MLPSFGSGNIVYRNNLVNNSQNINVEQGLSYKVEGTVVNGTTAVSWDNGTVGNYWSDYNGNGSYIIDQDNIDHHPLTQPVDISTVVPTPNPFLTIDSWFQPLIIATAIAAVIAISVLLYRRHRKTANLSK